MSPHASPTRRVFLQVLASATAAVHVASIAGCSTGPSGMIDAGNISDLPVGTLKAISGESVAIGHDDGGVYAMTLVCTHQGCDIETVAASGLRCGCHGATYDANGNPTGGPAPSALDHFKVTIDSSGALTIDADTTVDPSTRLSV